jgi:osmotically inducible lipoprotein OsmB
MAPSERFERIYLPLTKPAHPARHGQTEREGTIMTKFMLVAAIAACLGACTNTDQRIAGAAAGAGAGAIVLGPIGAVAGGAIGAVAGPSVTGSINKARE